MSLQTNGFYEFADFRLDLSEKVLIHGDERIALTPKIFDTLKILVQNAGRLLEKEELMREIWPDRFVDEGNLAFNVKVLRKSLGDDANEPKFIETVPRRGYRFIAKTRLVTGKDLAISKSGDGTERSTAMKARDLRPLRRKFVVLIAMSALMIFVIVMIGRRSSFWTAAAPVLSTPFASQKLSNDGSVPEAVISPDGKKVAYVTGMDADKESVWLRQLDSGENTEIIAPSDNIYGGLAFSPDDNYLYFDRKPRNFDGQLDMYRISTLGGIPEKILGETQGQISVSPDGSKISFVRCYYRDDEYCSLWTADAANGSNERKVVVRKSPLRISDNRFSPDGKSIAFAYGQSANQSNDFSVASVDLTTGQESDLSTEKFFNIRSIAWLPDQSGLLITASRIPTKNFRIWKLGIDRNEAIPLTNDSENYTSVSLNTGGDAVAATVTTEDFRLRIYDAENPTAGRILTSAESASFAPDGRVLFASQMSGSSEIWSMSADGSGQKQLTSDPADKSAPVADPFNKSIYFASNRTGAVQVWQMNSDGSDQKQITHTDGGFPLFVSSDNEWIYYQHGISRTLWRVSLKSGEEQPVLNEPSNYFAVSPDGSEVAYPQKHGDQRLLTLALLEGGKAIKSFPLADGRSEMCNIVWTPDGKNLAYIANDPESGSNFLWRQQLDETAPHQVTAMGNDVIRGARSLAVSPDQKTLAVIGGRWRFDAVLIRGLHMQ
jgi:Tol biopolymer transport system component/DNA-binding winged helix-turn-helix (wHTH) protein